MKKSNYYEDREKMNFSSQKQESENQTLQGSKQTDWMELIKNVGIDAGIAVLGGGAGAALLGQASFAVGLFVTGYGHSVKNDKLRTLGIGLMSSSSMTQYAKQDPKASMTENMKERLKAFGEEFKRKLYLDKLTKLKTETTQTRNLGGTEQKKNTASVTQNTTKSEQNPTSNSTDQTTPKETDYLNPTDTVPPDKPDCSDYIKTKYKDLDDEDFSGIEEKLY